MSISYYKKYRCPTFLAHVNQGWREFEALNADHAIQVYRKYWPYSAEFQMTENFQVQTVEGWKFTSEVSAKDGGLKAA